MDFILKEASKLESELIELRRCIVPCNRVKLSKIIKPIVPF